MPRVIGDNGGVSEAVWWKHYQVFEGLAKEKSNHANKVKKANKACKDDGIDPADFKDINQVRAQALAEYIDKHNRLVRMMHFVKHPAAPYMQEIDPTLSDETGLTDEQRQEKWENIGYVAGRSAADRVETMKGHDPNSDTGRWILAGYERGQAENAKGIKKGPDKAPKAEEPAPVADAKVNPKPEPEVVAAGAKKAAGKKAGVTYWHNAELKKVYEVTTADPDPEGAKPITKKEYEKLATEYAEAEKQNWEESAPAAEGEKPATGDDDGFDTPPDPDAA